MVRKVRSSEIKSFWLWQQIVGLLFAQESGEEAQSLWTGE